MHLSWLSCRVLGPSPEILIQYGQWGAVRFCFSNLFSGAAANSWATLRRVQLSPCGNHVQVLGRCRQWTLCLEGQSQLALRKHFLWVEHHALAAQGVVHEPRPEDQVWAPTSLTRDLHWQAPQGICVPNKAALC